MRTKRKRINEVQVAELFEQETELINVEANLKTEYPAIVIKALHDFKATGHCSNSLELVEALKTMYATKNKKLNTYCSGCMREAMKEFTNEYFSK